MRSALQEPIERVERRLRTQRAFESSASMLALALGGALLALLAQRLGLLEAVAGGAPGWLAWLACLALPLLGAAAGALRPLPPLLAARLLDRAHATNDLLASAVSFGSLPAAERTPFMEACVASAERSAAGLEPARAAALSTPRVLRVSAALLVAATAVLLIPGPTPPPAPLPGPAPRRPQLLQKEDVTLASAEIAPLLPALAEDPALAPLREELNALLEALKDERLERAEALLALREMQDRLSLDDVAADQTARDEALRELGKQLAGGGPEQALAEAMSKADAEQAQKEAEQLAQQLGQDPGKKAGEQDARLERALRRAAERPDAAERARERIQKEREQLLRKKQEKSAEAPEQQRLLQKKERELDQLEREAERQEQAERSLDELRRELGDGAKSMAERNRQGAQEHMQKSAQALQQLAKKKLSAEQRQALARKLEQLRELIAKQRGQNGQSGEDGQQGDKPGEPRAGQGTQRLDLARFGKLARGQGQGEGEQPGGDKPGQGGEPKLLVPGQGGEGESALMMPGMGEGQSGSEMDVPEAAGGSRAGQGGRPQLQGDVSARSGQHVDTRVEGQEGAGPTRSEVIHEAGQRGFASLGYQKVHAEYARHAERVLERDHVPGGYKFYVRRYFQLIRPREDAP